jgi:hypothetical protein
MSFKEWKFSSTVIEPVELVGEVFDLEAVAIFFDEFGRKYRKRMHVDTKSDVTVIPLSFARLLGPTPTDASKFSHPKKIIAEKQGHHQRVQVKRM